ncbi:hypothetical protein LTR84_012193 [Exophiala bonariae]|uniref:GPI inositol-deacylase winged helix domain-containing protein n=1 Tax=Exophiala bonariae TaxID=1690606 RepID=A0AAV9NJX0_9EURO|nr:hypothetical protein LTR84_012193 [Exophiala bonariae]
MAILNELKCLDGVANVFVTSRPLPSIAENFIGKPQLSIRADDKDMRKYIPSRLHKEPTLSSFLTAEQNLAEEIENAIVGKVQGIFLLAELHLNSLASYDNRRQLKKALTMLPIDYNSTFDDAITRIRQQSTYTAKRAMQVLCWITNAYEPLSISELQHALAVEIGDKEFYPDAIVESSHLISICCGLVAVGEGSRLIRLVHYTLEEYLSERKHELFPDYADEMTRVCLTYLGFGNFAMGPAPDDSAMKARLVEYKFFEYAATSWGKYASQAQDPETLAHICDLLGQEGNCSAAVQCISVTPADQSERHWTHFGLCELATSLLQGGANVDHKDGWGWTPLFVATDNDHMDMVDLLLKAGASIDHLENNGDTVASVAARRNNIGLVRLLHDKPADLKHRNHKGETLLHEAAWGDCIQVCEALLSWDFDFTVTDSAGCTALHQAVEEGSTAVSAMLLEKGLSPNHQDKYGYSVLFKAIMKGRTEIVSLLIKHGTSPNEFISHYRTTEYDNDAKVGGTAILLASHRGSEDIFDLLVAHGADVTATNTEGVIVLFEALTSGYGSLAAKIISLLSKTGPGFRITDAIIEEAARAGNLDLWSALLNLDNTITVEEDVMLKLTGSFHRRELIELFLTRGVAFSFTDRVFESILGAWDSDRLLPLVCKLRRVQLTDDILITALKHTHATRKDKILETIMTHASLLDLTDTALSFLAVNYSIRRVQPLMDNGSKIYVRAKHMGFQPLFYSTPELENLRLLVVHPGVELDEGAFRAICRMYKSDIIQTVLLSSSGSLITESMVYAVAAFGTRDDVEKTLELYTGSIDVERIMSEVCSSQQSHQLHEIMDFLLARFVDYRVSEEVLILAAKHEFNFEKLLSTNPDYLVTEKTLLGLIPGWDSLPPFLFAPERKMRITLTVDLLSTMSDWPGGSSAVDLLLQRPDTVVVGEYAVIKLARNKRLITGRSEQHYSGYLSFVYRGPPTHNLDELIDLMADNMDPSMISPNAVCEVALTFPEKYAITMLEKADSSFKVTNRVFNAVAANCSNFSVNRLLDRPRHTSEQSPPSLDVVSIFQRLDFVTVRRTLNYFPEIPIEADTLLHLTQNKTRSVPELLSFLWKHSSIFSSISATMAPKLLRSTMLNSTMALGLAKVILSECPSLEISETVLRRAANHKDALHLVQLFRDHSPQLVLHESTFCAAARQGRNGTKILQGLFSLAPSQPVTERILLAVLKRANCTVPFLGNWEVSSTLIYYDVATAKDTLRYLLNRGLSLVPVVTKALAVAATRYHSTEDALQILLRGVRSVDKQAVVYILKHCGLDSVEVLIEILHVPVLWSPQLLKIISKNKNHKREIMMALLKRERKALDPKIAILAPCIFRRFDPDIARLFLYRFWQGPLTGSVLHAVAMTKCSTVKLLRSLLQFDPSLRFTSRDLASAIATKRGKYFVNFILSHGKPGMITLDIARLARRVNRGARYRRSWYEEEPREDKDDSEPLSPKRLLDLVKDTHRRDARYTVFRLEYPPGARYFSYLSDKQPLESTSSLGEKSDFSGELNLPHLEAGVNDKAGSADGHAVPEPVGTDWTSDA